LLVEGGLGRRQDDHQALLDRGHDASVDVARLSATTNSYIQLLDAVMTLALVAGTDS